MRVVTSLRDPFCSFPRYGCHPGRGCSFTVSERAPQSRDLEPRYQSAARSCQRGFSVRSTTISFRDANASVVSLGRLRLPRHRSFPSIRDELCCKRSRSLRKRGFCVPTRACEDYLSCRCTTLDERRSARYRRNSCILGALIPRGNTRSLDSKERFARESFFSARDDNDGEFYEFKNGSVTWITSPATAHPGQSFAGSPARPRAFVWWKECAAPE